MKNAVYAVVAALLAVAQPCGADAIDAGDGIADAFQSPPVESRPRCWWHWMSNFISN